MLDNAKETYIARRTPEESSPASQLSILVILRTRLPLKIQNFLQPLIVRRRNRLYDQVA